MTCRSETLHRLFLSYARGDDERFVRGLYEDLKARGFPVWFDRESLPSRQLTFHQEIADAIRNETDRLIYVAGPRAAASDYVRQEWRYALELDRPVIPIQRLGTIEEVLPAELCLLHCDDFRDDAQYGRQLEKLVANLRLPAPPLGALHGVPHLPVHFLARPELLKRVRAALQVDLHAPVVVSGASGVGAQVGLQGMGGIGKSVLAAAVARDRELRRAFPDGVFWVSVGQQPTLVARQAELASLLGGTDTITSVEQGKVVLGKLLAEKAVVLVLDDVWDARDCGAFAALGPRGRVFVTTRDAAVLDALAGERILVELLTEPEAMHLLAETAAGVGRDPLPAAALPPEAREVVGQCGFLPLAIALSGGMVRAGASWAEILEAFEHAALEDIGQRQIRDGDNPHHRTLWTAMLASVEHLGDPDKRRRFAELAALATDRATPEAAVATFWGHTGGLGALATGNLLRELSERSLIQLEQDRAQLGATSARRVSLHDLLHDCATRLAGDVVALHEAMMSAYRARCSDGWASGPNDGYFLENIARHLSESGRANELCSLLVDAPTWMERKFVECRGDQSCSADIALALRGFVGPLAAAPDVVRVAGLRALQEIIRARTDSHRDIDLQTLVRATRAAEALDRARLRADRAAACEGLLAIAEELADPSQRREVLEEVRVTAEALPSGWKREEILMGLARQHADAGRPDTAAEILLGLDSSRRVVLLAEIGREDDALSIARGLADEASRCDTLRGVATVCARRRSVDDARGIVDAISMPGPRARALTVLATLCSERGDPRSEELFEEALTTARAMAHGRAEVVRDIAEAMMAAGAVGAGDAVSEAIEEAEAIPYHDQKQEALCRAFIIAGRFDDARRAVAELRENAEPSHQLAKALVKTGRYDAADEVARDAFDSRVCWAPLGWHVAELVRVGQFERAKAIAEGMRMEKAGWTWLTSDDEASDDTDESRARSLASIAEGLAAVGRFDEAERLASDLPKEEHKAKALRKVALELARIRPGDAVDIMQRAQKIDQSRLITFHLVAALGKVAAAVSGENRALGAELFGLAMAAAPGCDSTVSRDNCRAGLSATLVRAGFFPEAEVVMSAVKDAVTRYEGLRDLALALLDQGDPQGERVLARCVATANSAKRWSLGDHPAKALRKLVFELVERSFFQQAEDIAVEIISDVERVDALATLAAVHTAFRRYSRARVVIRWLSADRVRTEPHSFGYAQRVDETAEQRLLALCNLAGAMGSRQRSDFDGIVREVRATVSEISDETRRSRVLARLAFVQREGYLYERKTLDQLLPKAEVIAPREERSHALRALYLLAPDSTAGESGDAEERRTGLDDRIEQLVSRGADLDLIAPGLGKAVVQETIRIAGWARDDWRAVADKLEAARS